MRSVIRLAALLVCVQTFPIYAQTNAVLPDAPEVAAPQGDEAVPAPLQAARLSVALRPLPEFAVASFATPAVRSKIADRTFITVGALVFGLTAMDMEFTQYCLQRHTCVELDPALPQSHFGMYAVNTPVNVAAMYYAYHRRAAGRRWWWLAPAVAIGSHAAGVGSNARFLGK
jgi:hypothetical protein